MPESSQFDQDAPYSLKSAEERSRRQGMLAREHIRDLEQLVARIREKHPDASSFDPCDGGVKSRVLFLLEAPGPKAKSSGFVSRNNADQTAKNLCELLKEAGLARKDTVIWNVVPWYVGSGRKIRAVDKNDIKEAEPFLNELLTLLPNLEAVGLVGRKAEFAATSIRDKLPGLVVAVPHPSPMALNRDASRRGKLLEGLVRIADAIRSR